MFSKSVTSDKLINSIERPQLQDLNPGLCGPPAPGPPPTVFGLKPEQDDFGESKAGKQITTQYPHAKGS
ncbi:hypothetical protein DSO57_1017217 [Entomophthora muscae]|uniref:Uncharacterized protein n=1 Tax=Entomophthora muscae TaxID=34485 RepID=A0ACC2U2I9_9FUNG|nr:hypothetical protein DSO57_1017217 [Entomophthora muscae]